MPVAEQSIYSDLPKLLWINMYVVFNFLKITKNINLNDKIPQQNY